MKLAPFLRNSRTKRDAAPPAPPKPRRPGQFSIGTILVVMAMFAVALAAFQSSLGAGIGFLVLVLASLVRTAIVEALRARDRALGASTSVVSELFMSVPITMLAVAAGSVVFWVGCLVALALAMNNGRPVANLPIWPVGAGVILGSVAAGFLLWITRNAAKDI